MGYFHCNFHYRAILKKYIRRANGRARSSTIERDSCILEPEASKRDRLGVLIARGLVTPTNSMQIRVLNVSNRLVNLKAGVKVGDLLPIERTEQQLCLTTVAEEQKEPTISEIIDSF